MSSEGFCPSADVLLKIADAAANLANVLCDYVPLLEATPEENPGQLRFRTSREMPDAERLIRYLDEHGSLDRETFDLDTEELIDLYPDDVVDDDGQAIAEGAFAVFTALKGLHNCLAEKRWDQWLSFVVKPRTEVDQEFPQVSWKEMSVVGWPHDVSVTLRTLQQDLTTIERYFVRTSRGGVSIGIRFNVVQSIRIAASRLRSAVRMEGTCAEKAKERSPIATTAKDGSEGDGGHADENSPNRYDKLKKLPPAVRKAYLSFLYAEAKKQRRLEDQEAYDWFKEHDIDVDEGTSGELADYELPVFDTWSRQLRTARKALGEQKYTPRQARSTGRSIFLGHEIEHQHGDDE